jgi:hypothetical protein
MLGVRFALVAGAVREGIRQGTSAQRTKSLSRICESSLRNTFRVLRETLRVSAS